MTDKLNGCWGNPMLTRDILYHERPDFNLLKYQKLDGRAKAPTKVYDTDAGYDLYAIEDVVVPSIPSVICKFVMDTMASVFYKKEKKEVEFFGSKIKTGIAFEIPKGYVGLIWDRSSMGSKLLKVLGGVIDSSYRGDITVVLMNLSFKDYTVRAGDKVAQILIQEIKNYPLVLCSELEHSSRQENGFGSSGK